MKIKLSKVVLVVFSVVIMWSFAGQLLTFASEDQDLSADKTWRFHPPQYYIDLEKEREQRIQGQREAIDMRYIPEYRTVVENDEDNIIITRQTYQIVFSRQTCSVMRATILGEVMNRDCQIANLKVVDGQDTVFLQSLATDGVLKVLDSKFHTIIEGSFTPRSKEGENYPASFAVRYDLQKMNGLVVIRLKRLPRTKRSEASKTLGEATIAASLGIKESEEDSPKVKEVTFINSLGHTEEPLDIYQHYYVKDEQGRMRGPYEYEVSSESDRVLVSAKLPYALWTNGKLGFEVMPVKESWTQLDVDEGTSGDRFVTIRIQDGKRFINFNFVNRSEASEMSTDFAASFAFALMPFKKLQPRAWIASMALGNVPDYTSREKMEELARMMAAEGVTHMFNSYNIIYYPTDDKEREARRSIVNVCHKYGMKAIPTFLLNFGVDDKFLETERLISDEEYRKIREIASGGPRPSTTESPEWRHFCLNALLREIKEIGIDGVYHDLGCVFSTIAGWPAQHEGNALFMEEERLLFDSFGPAKFVLYHSGHQFSPAEAMSTVTFPGEPIAGGRRCKLPRAIAETAFNPLLLGTNIMVFNPSSFRLDLPDIYKQFLANGITSIHINWFGGDIAETMSEGWYLTEDEDLSMIKRYLYPFKTFDISTCQFHQRYDPDYADYVSMSNPQAKVNVYSRKNELLLVATLEPDLKGSVDINLKAQNLGIDAQHVFIYDIPNNRLKIVPVREDVVVIKDVDLTLEPRIFLVRECKDPERPAVIWHDDNVRVGQMQFPAEGTIPEDGVYRMQFDAEIKVRKPGRTLEHVVVYSGSFGQPDFVGPLGSCARVGHFDEDQKIIDLVLERKKLSDVTQDPGWKETILIIFKDFVID